MDGRGLGVTVESVVDGDTLHLAYSLEFGLVRRARARLFGVNAGEIFGEAAGSPARVEGEKHARFVREWVAAGAAPPRTAWPFIAVVHGPDKYGRDLITLERVKDGQVLNRALIDAFPAVGSGAGLADAI